jgi:hypothetical protein
MSVLYYKYTYEARLTPSRIPGLTGLRLLRVEFYKDQQPKEVLLLNHRMMWS